MAEAGHAVASTGNCRLCLPGGEHYVCLVFGVRQANWHIFTVHIGYCIEAVLYALDKTLVLPCKGEIGGLAGVFILVCT